MNRATAAYSARDLIARKRDGGELSDDELRWLIEGFTAGEVADYQMSAFAMAVLLRGMTPEETAALTLAMRDSGARARRGRSRRPRVDKHSTGGVGDKVSICLAPLVAACGVAVPMIAGRGLGHTGGTIDKLEAIDGYRVDLPLARFESIVRSEGLSLIGQTEDIAPADRRLYALRDVTATVPSVPLITASILSKKLCEDLDALVLDVKVGRGAFMKSEADARALARSMVRVGAAAGTTVTAVLTRMDCPLGRTVGNALETREAIELLHGQGCDDLLQCTLELGARMLLAAGAVRSRAAGERKLQAAVADGGGRARLAAMIAAHDGDTRVVEEPDRLPRAKDVTRLRAGTGGYVADLDAMAVARLAMGLGAGRARAEDAIDQTVGIVLQRKPGERVAQGEVLAEIHLPRGTTRGQALAARRQLDAAYRLARRRKQPPELVIGVVGGTRRGG
ncbi:MAG: thymidine phosphorylase [Myxococcales bacterium]|nr:thymidine phosphorylase [Myxococcales bacterium]